MRSINNKAINAAPINGTSKVSQLINSLSFVVNLHVDGSFDALTIRNVAYEQTIKLDSDFSLSFIPARELSFDYRLPIDSSIVLSQIHDCFVEVLSIAVEASFDALTIRNADVYYNLPVDVAFDADVIRNIAYELSIPVNVNFSAKVIRNIAYELSIPVNVSFSTETLRNSYVACSLPIDSSFQAETLRNVRIVYTNQIDAAFDAEFYPSTKTAPYRFRAAINGRAPINGWYGINGQVNPAYYQIAYFDSTIQPTVEFDAITIRNASLNQQTTIDASFDAEVIRNVNVYHNQIPVVCLIDCRVIRNTAIDFTMPSVIAYFSAVYDNNVNRWTANDVSVPYQPSDKTDIHSTSGYAKSDSVFVYDVIKYRKAANLNLMSVAVVSDSTLAIDDDTISSYHRTSHVDVNIGTLYAKTIRSENTINASDYQHTITIDNDFASAYSKMLPVDNDLSSHFLSTISLDTTLSVIANRAEPVENVFASSYKLAARQFSLSWYYQPTVNPPTETYDNNLDFVCRWDGSKDLDFVVLCGNKVIKTRKWYYMLHNISLIRLIDGQQIHINSAEVRKEIGSPKISISATVLGKASYNLLSEIPNAEVQLTINDYVFKGIVSNLTKSREFGGNSYNLTAVGFSWYLDSPFSTLSTFTQSSPLTLQQIVNHELYNFPGWSTTWDCANWLVSNAGTWSYTNNSALSAIQSAVESAGAFVDPHPYNKVLRIKPRYKVLPWNFSGSVNDLVIPHDVIMSVSKEFVKSNNYNSVYVTGTNTGGVLRFVKRAGSAGDKMPDSPISHALMTTDDATRAYGSAYIADNLDKYKMSLVLPINNQIPLVELGQLVKVVEEDVWQGIPTDYTINVNMSDSALTVRQSVSFDRFA